MYLFKFPEGLSTRLQKSSPISFFSIENRILIVVASSIFSVSSSSSVRSDNKDKNDIFTVIKMYLP